MNCAARARPASSDCASVKISSNWSKISSGVSGLPDASRSTSSRWCRNSHSDSPSTATPDSRPLPGLLRRARDRRLDLLRRRRRVARIIDAHVHRAIADRPQPRHDAGAQDRCLAEARLAEEQREELALHAACKLGHLLLAPVEVRPRFLGERREAEPRIFGIDRRVRDGAVEGRQRFSGERKENRAGGARIPRSLPRRAAA